MKKFGILLGFILPIFLPVMPVFAASADISGYTTNTLAIITLISTSAAVLFLIKGGYQYITSTGRPEILEEAKHTIKNAIIGLAIVLGANLIISVFQGALVSQTGLTTAQQITLTPIVPVKPQDGLTQVLLDAVTAFIQNIVESSTKPVVDGVLSFLGTTPQLLSNTTIFNFWLVSLGITDSLFVVVVAILGLHFMSASTLGFEEIDFKHLLPRIGLAFLGANVSLFLADYMIVTSNALVNAVLQSTGGINHAWIVNAINPNTIITSNTPLITLIFLIIFLAIAVVLLLMYITRLIVISLGAVLSPFIFLLWCIPKLSDAAEIAVKAYTVSVFFIFIHIVTIQLASSFLALPEGNTNPLLSVAIAIGLFMTLLKIPSVMMQIIFFSSSARTVKKLGGQLINVVSGNNSASSVTRSEAVRRAVKVPRKVVRI